MKYKLGKTRPEILELAYKMVEYAKQLTDDVEFAAEFQFLLEKDYYILKLMHMCMMN